MKTVLTLLFILCSAIAYCQVKADSVLQILNEEIGKRDYYFAKKEESINTLRFELEQAQEKEEKYHAFRNLYKSYISFDYDSAYFYARKSYEFSLELDNLTHKLKAKYDLIYCYLSAGLFMEAYNLLTTIDVDNIPEEHKHRYYNLYSRLYSKMADYSQDIPLHKEYLKKALEYMDAALKQVEPNTMTYDFQEAYKCFLRRDVTAEKKIEVYNNLIEKHHIEIDKNAAIAANLGKLYNIIGDMDKAIYHIALAAATDIRNAVRETTAMSALASYLYEINKIEDASKYIYIALEDANHYNARQRKLTINSILPYIEKDRVTFIQNQKSKLFYSLLTVSFLIVFISITLFIIYLQNRKLSLAKKAINDQLDKVSSMYDVLEESNQIKDQQIFRSLYTKSEYMDKVEIILKRLDRKLKTRQYNDINSLYKEFNLKTERETILSSFDEAFLKVFPNFVEEYNKLFQSVNQVALDEKGNLPPEVRIFALMRIGINDNDQIAKFLNLSLNTIYTYKTRVKNKTIVPKEEFEDYIMKIDRTK